MREAAPFAGSLYLGLATATAAITASAVGLGLLRPQRPGSVRASLVVVLAAVLGIAASFIVVATEKPTGLLNLVIATGLLLPGGYVLVRGLDSILGRRAEDQAALDGIRMSGSLPAESAGGRRAAHNRRVILATCAYGFAVVALLAVSVPGLLKGVLQPKTPKPEAVAGYSPSHRPVFSCLEQGRDCPGPGYATFNAYRNAPNYGDERAFVDAKDARIRRAGGFRDVLEVEPGERLIVRSYFDNAGDARFAVAPGSSTAVGARMRIFLPRGRREVQVVLSEISAANTIPRSVSDGVTLRGDEAYGLRYLRGSAELFNSAHPRGVGLPDALVSGPSGPVKGAILGFRTLDGRIEGNFQQSGLVTIEVEVV